MVKWPQFNETDLEVFLSFLQTEVKEDERIVRLKIENSSSKEMIVQIEPWGSVDSFPSKAIYEIVAIGQKETTGIHIQYNESDVIQVYCYGLGAIFDNTVATCAYAGFGMP
jgi:hypothetical protein